MNPQRLRGIAEAIGVASIVASLLFVGFQLRQDARIAKADAIGSYLASGIEFSQGVYPYAEIVVRSNRGENLSDAEQFVLDDIIRQMASNIIYQNWRIREIGGRSVGTDEISLAAFLYLNPGTFRARINSYLVRLDDLNGECGEWPDCLSAVKQSVGSP
jgi:hypothetical protein